jgi:glycosyltransferase involved in cell wall biosynthesis
MISRSTQFWIGAISALAAGSHHSKPLIPKTRRTAGRHPRNPPEAPWPSVPDRLVAALAVDTGSLTRGQTPTVSVIIPTLNEAESLPWVLEHLPSWVNEVVLVDGLSTDATEVLARRTRPDAVVVHQHRRGKGAALRAGFAAATGDIIVMIDADGSTDPREMHQFVAALKDGSDFVKGSRYMEGGGSADFTFLRSAGNKFFVVMANVIYGARFTDICYGYCAFWRKHLDALALTADGFEIETQLVLGAVKAGLEIRETPSFELKRRAGVSNLNAARDGLRILRTMLGQGDLRRDATTINFTLRKTYLPVWNTDRVPSAGERRWIDRRRFSRVASGYTWAEPHIDERRRTVGSVVAYRADYEQPAQQRAA